MTSYVTNMNGKPDLTFRQAGMQAGALIEPIM